MSPAAHALGLSCDIRGFINTQCIMGPPSQGLIEHSASYLWFGECV